MSTVNKPTEQVVSDDKNSEQVKVVLRRLPKYITEKEVLEQISPLPQEVIGTYFRPANTAFDRFAYATLTLLFSDFCDSLLDFESRFNGYKFVDSRGTESAACVESAVNQSFAKCDRVLLAEDSRVGAILKDKYYLQFCQELEQDVPVMTIEQQLRRLGRPVDIRTQIDRLETPLVKYLFKKETEKRRDLESRRVRRDERKKAKNATDFTKPTSSSATAPKNKEYLTGNDIDKQLKNKAKKKERDALRQKKKFLEEKQTVKEGGVEEGQKPVREYKNNKKRGPKPPRPSPAKTLGEMQGEDWIRKLTDPKSNIKKKHDISVTAIDVTDSRPTTALTPRTKPSGNGPKLARRRGNE